MSTDYEGLPWRRSVQRHKLPFFGWDKIMRMLYDAPSDVHRNIFTIYFLTGCRLHEGLLLKPSMFQLDDSQWIWCSQCLVLKHYKYLKDEDNRKIPETDPDFKLRRREDGKLIGRKWQTEGTYLTRTFPVARRKNPLAYTFETIIKNCKTEYLIPAELHFSRGFSKTEKASDKYVYHKIREFDVNNLIHVNNVDRQGNVIGIEDGLFPHLLRSQCASYLADELGASAYQLKEFFQWSSLEMSANYVETSRSAWNRLLNKSHV